MGVLEKNLPKIVRTALKEEDDVTRGLVNVLLNQVFTGQNKSSLRQIVINTLDSEIDKSIDAGFIDLDSMSEEN